MKMSKEFEKMNKLYHFTSFDTALKILQSNSLRYGRLNNMNDIHENDKLSYVDTTGWPKHDFPLDVLEAIADEMIKYRQISFSKDDIRHNKLGFDLHQMWGLYADKGKGVCLVFDKELLEKSFQDDIVYGPVSYDEQVCSEYISKSNDPNCIHSEIYSNVKALFFNKRKEWEHENEYRLIKRCSNVNKEEYLDFGSSLKYIILSSSIEEIDSVLFVNRIKELRLHINIQILLYGNGLCNYSLCDVDHENMIWNSLEGYNISIIGENCEINI